MSSEESVERNHNLKMDTKFFENMAKFIHAKIYPENQSFIHEEIESRLNSEKAYHHSVQNYLSSSFLSIDTLTEIYRNKTLSVVL
jgi:hypothetical protein